MNEQLDEQGYEKYCLQICHYKDWKGFNRFFFNGKVMSGNIKDLRIFLITLLCIFILLGGFYAFVSTYLTEHFYNSINIIVLILTLLTIFNYICVYFMDPGCIPRGNLQEDPTKKLDDLTKRQEDNYKVSNNNNQDKVQNLNESFNKIIEMPKKQSETSIYSYRYCTTCKIMRPPLSSHCGHCNNCVKNFDHHCYILGNCIGERNHKNFALFLLFGSMTSFFTCIVIIIDIIKIIQKDNQVLQQVKQHKTLYIFAIIICSLLILTIIYPCIAQLKLIFILIFVLSLFIILLIAWLKYAAFKKYYHNPIFSFMLLLGNVTAWPFLISNCMNNLYNISQGITVKQRHALQGFTLENKKEYIKNLTLKKRIVNFLKFMFKKRPQSLIVSS